jgi:hypothetical protein
MPFPFRISRFTRVIAGVLAVLALSMAGFLGWVVMREPDGAWAREGALLGLAFGALFLHAAVTGRSPRWLEERIGGRAPPPDAAPPTTEAS